jgi:putative mRNA 3-end processing factor
MVATEVELLGQGMRVRDTPLFLDAHRRTDLSFVSHAHGDHIARHGRIIATAATLQLVERRIGKIQTQVAAPYRQRFDLGTLDLELLPAGHVLGSAQLRLTRKGLRVTYTGDLNLVPSLTAEPAEVAHCDLLVLESTFGHPRYRFPPREETFAAMRAFVEESFARGVKPVFLAYALGKSQEAMTALARHGYPLVAHEAIADVCDVYAAHGRGVPHRRFEHSLKEGEVLFFPPHLSRGAALKRLAPVRTAVLTGWAVDESARRRYGADEAFPLSDHADFQGLVDYAVATCAKRVLTVHGGFAADLAAALRDLGLDAKPLETPRQMELF